MLTYVSFFLILFILSFLFMYEKKIIFIFFLLFHIFYSFAINIGPDWSQYIDYFHRLHNLKNFLDFQLLPDEQSRFELGFQILCFIISRFTDNYTVFLLIFNSITFVCYFKVFDEWFKKYSLFIFTFFIVFYGNRLFVSTLRQNFAVCISYLGLLYFSKNKYKKSLFAFLLAFLFHRSSIIVPILLLFTKSITRTKFQYVITIFCVFGLLGIRLGNIVSKLLELITFYIIGNTLLSRLLLAAITDLNVSIDILSIVQYIFVFVMTFFIIKDNDTILLRIAYCLIIFSFLFKFQFTNMPMLMSRLKYYFGIGYMIITFQFIKNLKSLKSLPIVVILYSLLLFIYSMSVIKLDQYYYIPYENGLIKEIEYSRNYDEHFNYKKNKNINK